MSLHVDLKNWNPPTIDEQEYVELRKTMTDEELCKFVRQRQKEQTNA